MSLGQRIRKIRESHGMTQAQFASIAGVSDKAVSTWENDVNIPRMGVIQKIADYFGITKSDIIDESNDNKYSNLIPIAEINNGPRVPVIGATAAGTPIVADREWDEYIPAPDGRGRADAALRVDGDSMEPRYMDGDYVYIRYQDDVDDGQIAAVCIDDSVTLKKVYHIPNGIYLVSENAAHHPPMTYTTDEVNNIHLLGLAVGFFRWEY